MKRRRKRLYGAEWRKRRIEVWKRDGGKCVRCGEAANLRTCHIDHIIPLNKSGTNAMKNLRTLCRRCHVLRKDTAHRGMIAEALKDNLIPWNWRELVW